MIAISDYYLAHPVFTWHRNGFDKDFQANGAAGIFESQVQWLLLWFRHLGLGRSLHDVRTGSSVVIISSALLDQYRTTCSSKEVRLSSQRRLRTGCVGNEGNSISSLTSARLAALANSGLFESLSVVLVLWSLGSLGASQGRGKE